MMAYTDTMMKLYRHITLGLTAVALTLPVGAAVATPAPDAGDMPYGSELQLNLQEYRPNNAQTLYVQRQQQRRISASRAKAAAMNRVRGAKFVNVQLVNQGTYRVRLQKNGRIVDVYVDAYTGQVKN